MIGEALGQLNWMAVGVSTLAAFGIGLVWFAPTTLGRIWARQVERYAGIPATETATAASRPSRLALWFGAMALNAAGLALAIQLAAADSLADGVFLSLAFGIGLGATLSSWPAIFARMPLGWWLLNVGAFLAMQVAMGAILGAWR
jgi:hypothetical protein